MSFIPSGVVVVATAGSIHSGPLAFTATGFCVVSCEPALVSVSVPRDSPSLAALRSCGQLAVSVLGEDQAHLAKEFRSTKTPRLEESAGAPLIPGATLHLLCELAQTVSTGDGCLLIAAVRRLAIPGGKPLVGWRNAFFGIHLDYPFLASAKALHQFVQRWECGNLRRTDWTHAAHIAVTAYYAFHLAPDEVFPTMKEGISRFNASLGVTNGPDSGYHETLTRFWSNIVISLADRRLFTSPLESARQAVELFGQDRDLHTLYYSFDVVRSRHARREWIAPDREPPAHSNGR